MGALRDVTSFFQVDFVHDVALADGWVAAAAGETGLSLCNPKDGASQPLATNIPLKSPILISRGKLFCEGCVGEAGGTPSELLLRPFTGKGEIDLKTLPKPRRSCATRRMLYYLCGEGDLIRVDIETGAAEIPTSPYGRYERGDHRVIGMDRSSQGVVVLARYAGRPETLVDSLPDDPRRPKARAAVLKDDVWGETVSGPAVASRRVHVICHEKDCLLSLHLHNPDVQDVIAAPRELCGQEEILLAAVGGGMVYAGSSRGLDLLAGPGAPAFFPFPPGGTYHPSRLIADDGFILLATREGRVFGIQH